MESALQIFQTLALAAVLMAMGVKMAVDMRKFRKQDLIPIRPGRVAVSAGLVLFGLYFGYQVVLMVIIGKYL